MIDEGFESSNYERARYEAYSMQDMLSPAPPRPTIIMRLRERLRSLAVRLPSPHPPRVPVAKHRVEEVTTPASNL